MQPPPQNLTTSSTTNPKLLLTRDEALSYFPRAPSSLVWLIDKAFENEGLLSIATVVNLAFKAVYDLTFIPEIQMEKELPEVFPSEESDSKTATTLHALFEIEEDERTPMQ